MKKRIFVFLAVLLIFLIEFSNVYSIEDGLVSLIILPSLLDITIHNPQNTTININEQDCFGPYAISLEVSANFNVDKWWYEIREIQGVSIAGDFFIPNTTIGAFRRQNILTVFANNSEGFVANKSVLFNINTSNHAPKLENFPGEILTCEGQRFTRNINASDCDGDNLIINDIQEWSGTFNLPGEFTINNFLLGETYAENQLFTLLLGKNKIGNYTLNISVSDGSNVDKNGTLINVLEINNPPLFYDSIILSLPYTVWTSGENNTFFREFNATDVEDNSHESGNLSYNISFSGPNLFGIFNNGKINYQGIVSDIGNHIIRVCATDMGIPQIRRHPLLQNVCGQTGGNQSNCTTFQLTVTNQNRPPTILNHFPNNLSFPSISTGNLFFNISKYDPDGTIPATFWYVDNIFLEFDNNLSQNDNFNFVFGCGFNGKHSIKAEITDGELNDSVIWNVTLINIPCPSTPSSSSSGGGGGGGVISKCNSTYICKNWNVCQNTQRSLEIGAISGGDYRVIEDGCKEKNFIGENCGFQIRNCEDAYSCNRTIGRPVEIQSCRFVINPSCNDGIKNCHSNGCEFLVDCGGPCGDCPTCSDGIQNQGELKIDCGGPCPFKCQVEIAQKINFPKFWIILLIMLFIVTSFLIYRVIKLREKLKQVVTNA